MTNTFYHDFKRFHKQNPGVYPMFERFAREAKASGRDAFGARVIWERMRWFTMIETDEAPWKLNNNYTSFYARLLMFDKREFSGFFKSRTVNSGVSDETFLADLSAILGEAA